jgi:hypothetical protein
MILSQDTYKKIEGLQQVENNHFLYKGVIDVYSYVIPTKGKEVACLSVRPGRRNDSTQIKHTLLNGKACEQIYNDYNGKDEADFNTLQDNLETLLYEYKLLKLCELDEK